jgi:hypothetical protein
MLLALVLINTTIFIALSGIHFYWLTGGKWGLALSLPSDPSTRDVLFKPSIMATLVVAFGLLLFAFITFGNSGALSIGMNQHYFKWGDLVISMIFLIRAIGDFKYVGFFKRIRETPFAKMDSKFYSPLCSSIFIIGVLIFILTPRPS